VSTAFNVSIDEPQYLFYCLMANDDVSVHLTDARVTGLVSVIHIDTQRPGDIGLDEIELWWPERRPVGRNLAFRLSTPLASFAADATTSGVDRPIHTANAWVASMDDPHPTLTFSWKTPVAISQIVLTFDADWEHPMESVLMGQPESVMPFCVKSYRIVDGKGNILAQELDNHQPRRVFDVASTTDCVSIEVNEVNGPCPAAIFGVRIVP